MKRNALLLTDGYKLDHRRQYPQGTEFVFSNWVARSNRHMPDANGVVVFGIQYLCKKYLIEYFNENFFNRPKDEVVDEFKKYVDDYIGPDNGIGTKHVAELHDLGYLPIEIRALNEGVVCPIGVPCLTVMNTLPQFFWVTNFLETIISNILWLPMTSATTAKLYKDELVRTAEKTGFYSPDAISFLCHDFSMRGMGGVESAILSGMGHLTSFSGSETLPAIEALKEYYSAGCDGEQICGTIPATEHSVMSAGGVDDELSTFKRLITDVYPNGFVSIVSDTWDFWKVMTDYLPKLKDIILTRDGRVVIRPDSGDPVDIICGANPAECIEVDGKYYYFKNSAGINCWEDIMSDSIRESPEKYAPFMITEAQAKGAYELLWEIFGGVVNEKGYKVIDTHVGMIYGDSITLTRQREIYRRLEDKGFAPTNLVLGIGSYTYNYTTRDALGFAMKVTWCQINGESKDIFKNPKTVIGMPKKSLKGLVKVYKDENGTLKVQDCITLDEWQNEAENELKTVFKNGRLVRETTLTDIRNILKNTK